MVIEPGDFLCFSGAHLHARVPNTSDATRYSVELRTVYADDVTANRGAPNLAGRAPTARSSGFARWPTERRCGSPSGLHLPIRPVAQPSPGGPKSPAGPPRRTAAAVPQRIPLRHGLEHGAAQRLCHLSCASPATSPAPDSRTSSPPRPDRKCAQP